MEIYLDLCYNCSMWSSPTGRKVGDIRPPDHYTSRMFSTWMSAMDTPIYKVCRYCGNPTPYDQLVKHKGCTHGVDNLCKSCNRAKANQWYRDNTQRAIARVAQYRKDHPEKRAGEWDRYYAKHGEAKRLRNNEWKRANHDRVRVHKLTRRARIEKAGSDFTSVDFAYMMGYWNDRCAVCGKQAGLWHTLAVDHWIPVSKGGGSTKTNLVPLCHAKQSAVECCNQNKSDKDPIEWLEGKFGKRKAAQILKRINAYFNALKGDDNGKH